MMKTRNFFITGAVALMLSACGGGSDSATSQFLSPGTHKLTFSAISTARLDTSISGIDVSVKFPAGITVSTVSGGNGQIESKSVTPGSSLQTTSLAFGNYSASTNTVYLSMATTQENYRKGPFLNLLFTVATGTSITADNIYSMNEANQKYKVIGYDAVTRSSVSMTGKVKTSLGVE